MIHCFIRSPSCAVKSYLCRAAKQPLQPDCFKSATANQIAQLQSELSPVESNNVYSIVTWFVGTNLWNDRGDDKTAFQVDRADLNRANTLVRPTVLFDCLGGKKKIDPRMNLCWNVRVPIRGKKFASDFPVKHRSKNRVSTLAQISISWLPTLTPAAATRPLPITFNQFLASFVSLTVKR